MALLFVDGFDHYSTFQQLAGKYNYVTSSNFNTLLPTSGRRNLGCVLSISGFVNTSLGKAFTPQAGWVVGAAFAPETPSHDVGLISLDDGGTRQVSLWIRTDRTLVVYRGTTLIGQSTYTVPVGTLFWNYFELKATISSSITAGQCQVRVNGAVVIDVAAGISTQVSANNFANIVRVGNFSAYQTGAVYIDDLYICDQTGAAQNDFLGDCRVDTLYPNGAGNYTQFIPLSGANFTNVDETLIDTADYNDGVAVGDRDSYAMSDLQALSSQTIYGVQVSAAVAKSDSGAKSIATMIRSGAVDADGAAVPLSTVLAIATTVYPQNPDGSVAWTEATVNAMEAGVKVTA